MGIKSPPASSANNRMLVFVDDSGDPGFKLVEGSSSNFVISLVIFDDELEAEKTAVAIKELKRTLGYPDDVEFKFAKSKESTRIAFLECVSKFQFSVRSIVITKNILYSEKLRSDKASFYRYAIKTVLQYNRGRIQDAKLRIDGSGDRKFRQEFLQYLRQELPSGIVRDSKFADSQSNVLIQLADMIAGTIRRHNDPAKSDSYPYRQIIEDKIDDEWRFR